MCKAKFHIIIATLIIVGLLVAGCAKAPAPTLEVIPKLLLRE